jgi:sirohydrochlorin cobaltochelatase
VAPIFMAQGAHLKRDLSQIIDAVRAKHRSIEIELLPAIGDVDSVLEAMCDWLVLATTR